MERRAPGDVGVKPVKRKRSSRPVAAVKLRSSVGIHRSLARRVAPRANSENRVTMSTPEEQMAAAIQQLNVRLQQPGTMATILQAERGDLGSQVQSATSTTIQKQPGVIDTRVIGRPEEFDGDPMKYTDWLSKLRAYFGAVDHRYQTESKTTEASLTLRLDTKLSCEASCFSTQMYYILVMTTAGSASDSL